MASHKVLPAGRNVICFLPLLSAAVISPGRHPLPDRNNLPPALLDYPFPSGIHSLTGFYLCLKLKIAHRVKLTFAFTSYTFRFQFLPGPPTQPQEKGRERGRGEERWCYGFPGGNNSKGKNKRPIPVEIYTGRKTGNQREGTGSYMDSRRRTSSERKLTFLRQESASGRFYARRGRLPEETVPTGESQIREVEEWREQG